MVATGRVGRYHWAELPGEQATIRDVVRTLRTNLAGLKAVNVSWDSGKLHELGRIPAGWEICGGHVVSPALEEAGLAAWPQSHCNSGRYDEWYFFRHLPEQLSLQPFCNWYGMSLERVGELAFPGGLDMVAQLESACPEIVIGDGTNLFVIAADQSTCLKLGEVECAPEV